MTDKEVGELWRDAITWSFDSHIRIQVLALIRKLIEERAWTTKGPTIFTEHQQKIYLKDALAGFGIKESEWE